MKNILREPSVPHCQHLTNTATNRSPFALPLAGLELGLLVPHIIDALGTGANMSSRDLLEMLGSGAAFGGKARQVRNERKTDANVHTSINFFSPGAGAANGTKSKRESTDGRKLRSPAVNGPEVGCVTFNTTDRSSLRSNGGAGLALFRKNSRRGVTKGCQAKNVVQDDQADTTANLVRLEEIACFRRRMGIRVRGQQVVDPMESFSDMPQAGFGQDALQARRVLLQNVEGSAWKEPTPIQMQAVPILVAGCDLLASAPTGSGKTAAFVMPMILKLGVKRVDSNVSGVRGVLLAPTRELAAQIHRDVIRLSRGRKLRVCLLTKAGATKAAAAAGKKALSGYDIVVSTPMRLVTLVRDGAVSLATVEMVVLDEADKLFDAAAAGGSDKAFVGQVDEVLAACSHRDVQRALFSATIGQRVSIF